MATAVPLDQQQPGAMYPEAVSNGPSHGGSVGPFFAVISVIAIFSALACLLGRICGGRLVGLESTYDCVGWMEMRCSSCIDGDIEHGAIINHDVPIAKVVANKDGGKDSEAKPDESQPTPLSAAT
ncbi:hypothetical protein AMTRI_Chr01g135240 [Amborella trichopoda]